MGCGSLRVALDMAMLAVSDIDAFLSLVSGCGDG
jgi:hypothetical protein